MKYINLKKYGRQKDSFYFALEKYLLTIDGDYSFLWTVFPAVIIGKHQIINQEINQQALEKIISDYLDANQEGEQYILMKDVLNIHLFLKR